MEKASPTPTATPFEAGAAVLLVDPDPGFARSVQILLEEESRCRVLLARSFDEALRRLALPGLPRVILSDLQLPDGDGLELLRQLRERQLEASFILVTAHLSPVVVTAAERLGARCCLRKPIDPERLLEEVNGALAEVGGWRRGEVGTGHSSQTSRRS